MRIIVDGSLPSEWKKDMKARIKDNEIRSWEFITEEDHERLLHTGDEQYEDVVIRLVPPTKEEQMKGCKYIQFVPTIRKTVKGKDERKIASNHLGIVLGRFAEILNCHYADTVKKYQTLL